MTKKILMGGVCGMGMSPLAIFLKEEGAQIEGFDDSPDEFVTNILKQNEIYLKKRNEVNFCGVDELILSSALKSDFQKFQNAGVKKILRRGEALAEIAGTRRLIGVCGSHGKTTTTTLISHALQKIDDKFGFITGAIPNGFPPAKYSREGEFLAAELDESDGTIEKFSPEITVALNADLDHIDTYANNDELFEMFARLFERTSKYIVIPNCDAVLLKVANKVKTNAKIVSVNVPQNDFFGYDKAMALASLNLAFDKEFDAEIFSDFKGIRRRQEVIFNSEKIFAIADYAHHPNEVVAFVKYLDSLCKSPRLIFFQPHRYTRTKYFGTEFRDIFAELTKRGDKVYILPVYAASEAFVSDGTSKNLQSENVKLADFEEMEKIIKDFNEAHSAKSCVAFIGAGDIYFKAKKIFDYEKA